MNESDFPDLHAYRSTAGDDGSPPAAPTEDRNTFIANLHRIGSGAAADGQPWPERHQLPGRCLALADADCALSGLRVVLEMLLAAERTRQNGDPGQYVGDRVMRGWSWPASRCARRRWGGCSPKGERDAQRPSAWIAFSRRQCSLKALLRSTPMIGEKSTFHSSSSKS